MGWLELLSILACIGLTYWAMWRGNWMPAVLFIAVGAIFGPGHIVPVFAFFLAVNLFVLGWRYWRGKTASGGDPGPE